MPELPEVETVKEGLNKILEDQPLIQSVSVSRKKLRFAYPSGFKRSLVGLRVKEVKRRAKYLIFKTDGPSIICHLGMTGNWRSEKNLVKRPHDHVFLKLSSGKILIFNDTRRFGYLDLVSESSLATCRWFQHLGPEPLEVNKFTSDYLFAHSRKKTTSIKAFIMKQEVVVGVGNIYASEALFLAGLHPKKQASLLNKKQCEQIVKSIRKVLRQAILKGGTTIKDFQSAGGSRGYFQLQLNVYGRSGESCHKCKSKINKLLQGGRSTFYCPNCQS